MNNCIAAEKNPIQKQEKKGGEWRRIHFPMKKTKGEKRKLRSLFGGGKDKVLPNNIHNGKKKKKKRNHITIGKSLERGGVNPRGGGKE